MGILDRVKALLGMHDDKVDQGLDKVGDAAKGHVAGHDDQIDSAVDKAKSVTGEGDTTAAEAAPPKPAGEGEQ